MYATQADLQNILPQTAFGTLTPTQINAALQQASDEADGYFRNRWGKASVPFVAWDTSVTRHVADIAAYYAMQTRGYRSQSGADSEFEKKYLAAVAWLDKVQKQQITPLVTLAATGLPGSVQPNLVSTSVVDVSSGRVAPNRGW